MADLNKKQVEMVEILQSILNVKLSFAVQLIKE